MTAKPPNLSETMAAIRRALLDRDDAMRRLPFPRRRAGRHIANTALEAVIRAAIEDYAETATASARKAMLAAHDDRDAAMKDLARVDQQNQALSDELSELRPKLHNAETVRDELRNERDDLGARLDRAVTEITGSREQIADLQGQLATDAESAKDAPDELTELRERAASDAETIRLLRLNLEGAGDAVAELQGQLAISADHLCEPLAQRTRQANAEIRKGLDTAPEANAASEVAPKAARTPAKPRTARSATPGTAKRENGSQGRAK